jgi:hypothetical protein
LSGSSNTISGSGSLTFDALNVTGNISTARNITINSDLSINGSLTATSGTITFNGASALSGTANLYNVSIQAGDTLQLGTGATLGIAGAFTQNGILDVTTTIPNTINYNSGSQTVTATTYDNLTLSNGGTKTAANSLTIDGDLTIASGTTFDAGPYSHTIYGNIINNGTFTASTSNVQMLGSNDASISGATTFNTLTINKTSSDNVVTLQSDVTADTLNMISGQLNTGSHTITITSTRIGTGTIIGTIKWQPVGGFTNGTAYPFEGTNTITFASGGGNVSSITITVKLGPVADFPFGSSINREYDIVANGTDYDATLRLHYENSELNGNNETLLDTWHYNGNWTANGQSGRDTSVNYVDRDSLTDLNGRWTLAEIVSVLRWTGAVSPDWENVGNWSTVQNSSGGPPGTRDVVNIGDTVFTNQPTINSDVNIRGIAFSSTTATNLTISSGSLSTFGNISGTWSSSQSHSITISTHNLTIGGSLVLSDGTTGHNIDLTTSGSVSIVGSLTQTGDASVSIVSGMLEIGGDYNTNGSFSAGSGTVMYNGSSSQIVAPLSYYNLAFNKSSGTATLSSTAIVNGKMTLATGGTFLVNGSSTILTIADSLRISTGATLNGGSSAIKVAGHWSNSGTFTPASGTIELYGGNAQNVNTSTFNNFVINKSTGTTVTLIGNITVNGNLTDSSGTLDLSTFTANRTVVGGTLRLAGGTTLKIGNTNNFPANFSANSLSTTSTVEYIINGSQTIAPITYGNLTLSSGGSKNLNGSTTVAGNLTIDNGITLNAGVSSLTLQGNWINNGIFTSSSNLVQLSGSSKAISGNSITFHSLSVLGSYSTSTNITVDSNAIISGSITADPATTLTFVGDISNSGTLTTSGIVTFNGTQVQNIALNSGFSSTGTTNFNGTIAPVFSGISSPQFSILNINNTDTAGISPSIGWNVNGTFTVASGVKFYGGVATHTFNSTFTNNGTVTSDGGTLIFSPSTATTITLGSSFSSTGVVEFGGSGLLTIVGSTPTINTLTISNTNSAGVTLPAGWTIIADLIIETNAKLNGGSSSYSIGGSWINYGTFDGQASTVTMTDTSVITGTGTTFNNIIIASGAAVTAISGFNIAGNLTVNGIFDGTGQNIIFSGNTSSTIAGTSTITLDIVSIAKTSATTTLNQSLNGISLLNVIGGTLDIITYSVSEVAGTGTLQIDADATLKISGANNFPSFTTYDFDPASNVEYNSSGAQTISITPEYGNLVLSNGGNKSAALPGLTINGNFTLNGGNFTPSNNTSHQVEGNLNIAGGTFTGANNTYISIGGDFIMSGGTFAPGNNTDTISGNWTMSGGSFTTGSSTIIFNGSSDQTISSTGAFNNLNISKTSGALTLGIDATINGTLTFTDGKITTGSNKVIIGTSGNVTGANANRYVVGNLQKNVATGAPVTRVFEIGDASTYARDSIVFASVTTAGNLTASTTAGDHPNIITDSVNAVKSVNRYWTLTNSGIVFTTYSATFNFPSGDIDPGATTGNFIVSRYNGSSWSYPNIGTKTSNSTQGIAINSLSDFQIGEPFSGLNYTWDGGGDKRSWGDANNWNPNTIPSSGDNVNLIGPDTIDINIAASCLTISINNSQFRINILSGGDLAAAGNLIMAGGVFNTEASFPTVSGSVSLTGGTFGYTASSGTQTIAGQTYNNLVLSGGGTKTASGNITINSDLTISAGTLALGTYTANRATSGGTLTLASGTTLKVGGTTGGISGSNFPTNFSTVTLNGTVEFSGSGAQVSVLNYTNLALSGSGTKSLAGNISISGDLNITAGTLNLNNNTLNRTVAGGNLIVSSSATLAVGGSSGGLPGSNFPANFTSLTLDGLINFNGTSAQTIPAINYNNLTVSNTGSVTLANSGTIGIAGVFTPGTATYTITGSTISYNGTTAQNIVTFNYNNLTISNTGSVTLASSGTIGIASVFTPDTATYTITGSTFDYNGSSSQTITAFDYNNLVISGSGSKTLANNITVAGDLTITSGSLNLSSYTANRTTPGSGTLSVSSGATLLVGGSSGGKSTSNFPNNYSNNTLSGTVEFNGSSPQTIPELTYSNMIFSNPVSITIDTSITATGSVLANLGSSWIVPSGVIFTINGNLRNRGSVTNDGTVNIGP